MSKTVQEARTFFKKSVQPENDFTEGFESVSPIQTPTIAIPITIELTEKEKLVIQKILVDDYQPGVIPESRVSQHVEQLTNITKQIKSISAQSVLLHGERIKQAQELLADYREGAFTKWLMSTYGNRQTPYSMLRYYEFYQSAPKEARPMIESAPKKAVYLLASRDGDQDKKFSLIQEYGTYSQSDLLLLIQSTFPTMETDKRKPSMSSAIEAMGKLCFKLESRSKNLSDSDRKDIEKLIQRLQKL
jgi:hypothetical protein